MVRGCNLICRHPCQQHDMPWTLSQGGISVVSLDGIGAASLVLISIVWELGYVHALMPRDAQASTYTMVSVAKFVPHRPRSPLPLNPVRPRGLIGRPVDSSKWMGPSNVCLLAKMSLMAFASSGSAHACRVPVLLSAFAQISEHLIRGVRSTFRESCFATLIRAQL